MDIDPRVLKLLETEQYTQRTKEWYEARANLITASSASNLLTRNSKVCDKYIETFGLQDTFYKDDKCCNPYSSKLNYYLDKCRGSTFKGNIATYHGQKYEEVASNIYSVLTGKRIIEFGLIKHPTLPWLGASPDGITTDGIMVEIKCPYRRKIDGIPPFYYYIQCLLQMECCDLEVCDFIEFEFVEFKTEREWLDDVTLETPIHFKGVLLSINTSKSELPDPQFLEYIYAPKELLLVGDNVDTGALLDWKSTEIIKRVIAGVDINKIETIYWKVTDYAITKIERDPVWFKNVIPVFEKEWNLIKYYKKGDNYKKLLKKPTKSKKTETTLATLCLCEPELCVCETTPPQSETSVKQEKPKRRCIF